MYQSPRVHGEQLLQELMDVGRYHEGQLPHPARIKKARLNPSKRRMLANANRGADKTKLATPELNEETANDDTSADADHEDHQPGAGHEENTGADPEVPCPAPRTS